MIEQLTTEAMTKQPPVFFRELFKECNLPAIEPSDEMSLKSLIDMDLMHFRDTIREVSEKAEIFFQTEKQLSSIEDKLKETPIELVEFRDSQIIANTPTLLAILADSQALFAELKATDRAKLAPKKAAQIEAKLDAVRKNLNHINEFQSLFVRQEG